MGWRYGAAAIALGLCLAACDGGGTAAGDNETAGNAAAANTTAAGADTAQADGRADLPACPFRRTREWIGSVEGGRVLVNGSVDLQMAGFRPALSERPGAPAGTLALDLALVPEPNAPVADRARYERRGVPAFRRGEIWCGGERIAGFDMIVVK